MAELHVVAALKDKRAELSGSIADLEKRIGVNGGWSLALPQTRCNRSVERTDLPAPASRCLENTMTQQVKSGTPTHRALDCLQVADLPFHRAGTPRQ